MTTLYPGALDTTTQLPNDQADATFLNRPGVDHAQEHVNLSDAVRAIEAELGLDPSGTYSTVRARLDAIVAGVAAPQYIPSVEVYGAVPNSTAAASANVTAINNALQAESAVCFPQGKTFYVNATLIVPSNTMIYLDGNVMVPAAASVFPESPDADGVPRNPGASVFFFKNPTLHFDNPVANPNAQDRGFGGGITGHGTIDSKGRAHYHVDVSSWHHADFSHFRSVNPRFAHFHCQPGIARTPQLGDWLDSDFHSLYHLDFAFDSTFFPKRGVLCEDGGCNDSTIEFLNIVGLAATSFVSGVDQLTGGWGLEFKNCDRYKIVDTYTGDNTRCVSGGLLITQDALGGAQTRDQHQNCQIDDFYVEAQPITVISGWRHAAVKIQMTSTAHLDATDIMMYRVKYAHKTGTDNYWLWTTNAHASRVIDGIEYTSPRGHLNANNNIILSTRTNNSLIEVRDAGTGLTGEAAFITNSGTSNYVRHSRSGNQTLLT